MSTADRTHGPGSSGSELPGRPPASATLKARIGLFDASMIVMGGIVGAGIFINPYVVARSLQTPLLILGAWAAGGVIALIGAFVYAELAARLPRAGGQYVYLSEAYHPLLGFLYGWVLLLVVQTGGMAAVAITFALYFLELTHLSVSASGVAAVALLAVAVVNCFGVRAGSRTQSVLMVAKIVVLAGLIAGGVWVLARLGPAPEGMVFRPMSHKSALLAFGVAMVPVLFAYGGWQTANFVAEEIRRPRWTLPRALVLGVSGVAVLYLAVNAVCVYVLGPAELAEVTTPASAVMKHAFGDVGARWIAAGIMVSTLGFLSQSILTTPRVYFAMARDRNFFRAVAWIDPRRGVPTVAILLQAGMAIVIALSGRYDQILSYVVSMDVLFFGVTATSLFVFRRREAGQGEQTDGWARVPGHPWTTILFMASCWLVVLSSYIEYPINSGIGLAILLAGVPAYYFWRRKQRQET